ncbi:MAG: hypothetical protein IH898_13470, partial [Planctomycetes bacterium]|nr:hypothetical protein [Planctomycetota bacterium]
ASESRASPRRTVDPQASLARNPIDGFGGSEQDQEFDPLEIVWSNFQRVFHR